MKYVLYHLDRFITEDYDLIPHHWSHYLNDPEAEQCEDGQGYPVDQFGVHEEHLRDKLLDLAFKRANAALFINLDMYLLEDPLLTATALHFKFIEGSQDEKKFTFLFPEAKKDRHMETEPWPRQWQFPKKQ